MGVNVKRGGSYAAALGVSAKAGGVYAPAVPYVKAGGLYVPQGLFSVDANFLLGAMPAGWALARASTGTRFNNSGTLVTELANVARFDYDLATLAPRGVLDEGSVTNIVDLGDISLWQVAGAGATKTANAGLAPDGTNTATQVGSAGTAATGIYRSFSVTPGSVVTWDVFCQLGTMSRADFKAAFYNDTAAGFFATDVQPSIGNPTAAGFTRLSWIVTTPAGCTSMRFYPFRSTAAHTGGTILLWGPMGAVESFPSSHIPTTTAAVTRAADILTTTLPSASDVLVQDRNGAEWRLAVPSGAYTASPRAGQTAIARIRAVPTGYYSASQRAAIAAANSLI